MTSTADKKIIYVLTAIAFTLLFSWLEPSLRLVWDSVDITVFRLLNDSLAIEGNWTYFWALMNYRMTDVFVLIVMTLFLIIPGLVFKENKVREGLLGFVTLLFFMLIIREALDLFVDLFSWDRSSPSISLDNTHRLSEMYPELKPKDSSTHSFPGDHAGVLMLWAGYCFSFARNKWSWTILVVTLFFMLPRLVGGGHWLSDDLVGGGFIMLLTLAWVRYSFLYLKVTNKLVSWFSPLIDKIALWIPLLQRMAFFKV